MPCVGIYVGVHVVIVGFYSLRGGRGGGSGVEGGREDRLGCHYGGTREADGDVDEVHLPQVILQGGDERVILCGFLYDLVVAPEVPADPDLLDEDGTSILIKRCWTR